MKASSVNMQATKFHSPRLNPLLPIDLARVVQEIIPMLVEIPDAQCLFLGGSTASGIIRVGADVDLWLVAADAVNASLAVRVIARSLSAIAFVHEAGFYPWFGDLTTVFVSEDGSLSLDIGVCSSRDIPTCNPGPNPQLVWGDQSLFDLAGTGIDEWTTDKRLAHLTITLVKLRKAARRRHLWNALAYLAQARNDLIDVARALTKPAGVRYSRPEHGAEDWLDQSLQQELTATHASYNAADIVRCGAAIGELACRIRYVCGEFQPWWRVLEGVTAALMADDHPPSESVTLTSEPTPCP